MGDSKGMSLSAWMTDAARHELKVRDDLAAVGDWEAEHGTWADHRIRLHDA
jgi:hypothetical protein